jgi:hypothetical protein
MWSLLSKFLQNQNTAKGSEISTATIGEIQHAAAERKHLSRKDCLASNLEFNGSRNKSRARSFSAPLRRMVVLNHSI